MKSDKIKKCNHPAEYVRYRDEGSYFCEKCKDIIYIITPDTAEKSKKYLKQSLIELFKSDMYEVQNIEINEETRKFPIYWGVLKIGLSDIPTGESTLIIKMKKIM